MKTPELRLGSSDIREMYLSVGAGVNRLFCEKARLELFNFHEGKLEVVDFGISVIERAYINKSTSDIINAEGLRANLLYFGNHKNTVGELRIGPKAEIQHVAIDEILPTGREGRILPEGELLPPKDKTVLLSTGTDERRILGKLSLGLSGRKDEGQFPQEKDADEEENLVPTAEDDEPKGENESKVEKGMPGDLSLS